LYLVQHENRSVWIAQREGELKTEMMLQIQVFKMLAMGSDEANLMDYFKS
jgi:hypothetical protein